jgi:hypothetical protein
MADLIETTHDVATFDEDDGNVNVLVLPGHDVIVPVEMDPDGDPLQDDGIALDSIGGAYRRFLRPGGPDVEADLEKRRWFYRFRDVPYGVYRVALHVGETWTYLLTDLIVRREGVFAGGKKLGAQKPADAAAPSAELEPASEPVLKEGETGIADQVEAL